MVARVVTSGGILVLEMMIPLMNPQAIPDAREQTIASARLPESLRTAPKTMALSWRMYPTDRSMPPVVMMKVIARAMMPISPTMDVVSKSTLRWKNTGCRIPNRTMSATSSAPRAAW